MGSRRQLRAGISTTALVPRTGASDPSEPRRPDGPDAPRRCTPAPPMGTLRAPRRPLPMTPHGTNPPAAEHEYDFFKVIQGYLDAGAKACNLPQHVALILSQPKNEIIVHF